MSSEGSELVIDFISQVPLLMEIFHFSVSLNGSLLLSSHMPINVDIFLKTHSNIETLSRYTSNELLRKADVHLCNEPFLIHNGLKHENPNPFPT